VNGIRILRDRLKTWRDGSAVLEENCRDTSCRSYLHDYQTTIKASQKSITRIDDPPAVMVPEDFVQAVLKARKDV